MSPILCHLSIFVLLFAPFIEARGCPWGWLRFGGHCYVMFNSRMNWHKAQLTCRRYGANLVQIDSLRENNWLRKKFRQVFWTDGTDLGTESEWNWFSIGRHIWFQNWSRGQPDNGSGTEHCLQVNWPKSGHWNDDQCYNKMHFVCEWKRKR